jgi:hypothetical protein
MSSHADVEGGEPLAHHPDDILLPSNQGNAIVYLGKEAILSWFTGLRSEKRRTIVDRLCHLGHPRVLFKTSVYQLVEVVTKVRYAKSANAVVELYDQIADSIVRVRHGSDDWGHSSQSWTPKGVFRASSMLFGDRPGIPFSFPEAALVLSLVRERENRQQPVYLFTFDGTLATLADTFDVPVLPYSTPLRDDTGR